MIEKLTKMIYSNSRMELEFFMHLPSLYRNGNSDTARVQSYPSLYLRYKKNAKLSEAYDYNKARYRITPSNLYDVVKLFNTAVSWLYTSKYEDLFLTDDNNQLIFNADYQKLSAITPRGMFDQDVMQVVPAVIRFGDKAYEGVHLYINTSTYCIPLTYREVGMLFNILKDFRFSSEMTSILQAYQIALAQNRFGQIKQNNGTPFD